MQPKKSQKKEHLLFLLNHINQYKIDSVNKMTKGNIAPLASIQPV